MGRIKTTLVKRVTKDLIREYGNEFKDNFEDNKKALGRIAEIKSIKIRNAVAGYITRIKKSGLKSS